jgi:hypothetical protein
VQLDLGALEEAERMCFFLNMYNALTIHAIVEASVEAGKTISSVLDVASFWKVLDRAMGVFRRSAHFVACSG